MRAAATHPVLALQERLAESQWHSAERLRALQLENIARLLVHAKATVPFYRERLAHISDTGRLDLEALRTCPVLSRRDLQSAREELLSTAIPEAHGALFRGRSSGSTGMPVEITGTAYDAVSARAIHLRNHLWHDHDFTGHLAALRKRRPGAPTSSRRWGGLASYPFPTGPSSNLDIGTEVGRQLEWLVATDPDYLVTYPSNLRELARESLARKLRPQRLRQVLTLAEVLDPDVRALCREAFGAAIADSYSAEEVGPIALQCPESESYHVQSEHLFLEVLREDGSPCDPGEVGQVTVTPLHNYAMPLIRYQLGDWAELGDPCSCGRGLPAVRRIRGRTRNVLITAAGARYWPSFGSRELATLAPVRQHQFIQTGFTQLVARFVAARPFTATEEERVRSHLIGKLPFPMDLSFEYVEAIPRSAAGKFEDFQSLVAGAPAAAARASIET